MGLENSVEQGECTVRKVTEYTTNTLVLTQSKESEMKDELHLHDDDVNAINHKRTTPANSTRSCTLGPSRGRVRRLYRNPGSGHGRARASQLRRRSIGYGNKVGMRIQFMSTCFGWGECHERWWPWWLSLRSSRRPHNQVQDAHARDLRRWPLRKRCYCP